MSSKAERFGRIFLARRNELELTQLQVWDAGGPSNTKQTEIEKGESSRPSPKMRHKIEVGLQWESGSALRVWEGGQPTPLMKGAESSADSAAVRDFLGQAEIEPNLRRELLDVIERHSTTG